jgi:hypothetical protein
LPRANALVAEKLPLKNQPSNLSSDSSPGLDESSRYLTSAVEPDRTAAGNGIRVAAQANDRP